MVQCVCVNGANVISHTMNANKTERESAFYRFAAFNNIIKMNKVFHCRVEGPIERRGEREKKPGRRRRRR